MNKPHEIDQIVSFIEPNGLLSQKLKGFEPREGQKQMLQDVLEAYLQDKTALIEAGTGTGKSIAYLIPALVFASSRHEISVISTNTIALQEQLLKKDLPFLLEALDLDLKVVLVKGMSNYLCLRKLEDLSFEKRFFPEKEQQELERLEKYVEHDTSEGCRSSFPFPISQESWEKVEAERESCTHAKCPHYQNCFFFKARKEVEEAHVLVVNHHLLFADLHVRYESNNYQESYILPPYKRLILDEAHHIGDVAQDHFGKKVSYKGFVRALNRLHLDKGGGKLKALIEKIRACNLDEESIKRVLERLELEIPLEKKELLILVEELFRDLLHFIILQNGEEKLRIQDPHLQDETWTNGIQSTVKELVIKSKKWIQSVTALCAEIQGCERLQSKCEGLIAEITGLLERVENMLETLIEFVFSPLSASAVRFIEKSRNNLHLITAPLEVSSLLAEALFEKMPTLVLCSATLSSQREFGYIRESLGIKEAKEAIYDSPFNYVLQSLLLVPSDLPHPDHRDFLELSSKRILEAVERSQGQAFVLFTSYQSLKATQNRLQDHFQRRGLTLLCQGDEAAHALLKRFRETKKAVLFGTDSFWEGVDVVGDALRCVIIVKLPFLVPSDPLVEATSEHLKSQGKSPFFHYSLPKATMKLKQGFGRLIRSKSDKGCVLCLDSRLATKGYGKIFLKTLPSCSYLFDSSERVMEKMQEFYSSHFQ